MKTAPTAAIVISISIENGVSAKAAENARFAMGTSPISIASRNAQFSMLGTAFPKAKATANAVPHAIVASPLLDRHHGSWPPAT